MDRMSPVKTLLSLTLLCSLTNSGQATTPTHATKAAYDFSPYCPKPVNGFNRYGDDILTGQAHKGAKWQKHQALKSKARSEKPRLVFLGDSMVELFDRATMNQYFGKYQASRYGISGDTVRNLIWRLENHELQQLQPDVVVVMIGANDAGIHSNVEIGQGITRVVDIIHKQLPQTEVLLMNVLPAGKNARTGYRRQLRCINHAISPLANRPYVTISNAGAHLLNAAGIFRQDLTRDFIHPNRAGYQILASQIAPIIAKLINLRDQKQLQAQDEGPLSH